MFIIFVCVCCVSCCWRIFSAISYSCTVQYANCAVNCHDQSYVSGGRSAPFLFFGIHLLWLSILAGAVRRISNVIGSCQFSIWMRLPSMNMNEHNANLCSCPADKLTVTEQLWQHKICISIVVLEWRRRWAFLCEYHAIFRNREIYMPIWWIRNKMCDAKAQY